MKKAPFALGILVGIMALIIVIIAIVLIIDFSKSSTTGKIISNTFGSFEQGEIILQSYELSEFENVELKGRGNLYITQGDNFSVKIKAGKNILNKTRVEVFENTLIIDNKELFLINQDPINIYVVLPEVNALSISGSGTIQSQNLINTKDLSLTISGSGKITMNVNTEILTTRISGSGDAYYSGKATEQSVTISGSGKIKALDLESKKAFVKISGSCAIGVFVTEELKVKINGSGKVKYKGNPVIDQSISGSGSVKSVDGLQ